MGTGYSYVLVNYAAMATFLGTVFRLDEKLM